MRINVSTKQIALERLLHCHPKKTIARELGISQGSLRDWSIMLSQGIYDWVDHSWVDRKELVEKAVDYWFEHQPSGYSDVARMFGVRPACLYASIKKKIAKLPKVSPTLKMLLKSIEKPVESVGRFTMKIEKLSDIPADRPLTKQERKALFRELEEAKVRLEYAKNLLEVAYEDCSDIIKKKELKRQIEQYKLAIQSLCFVGR